MNNYIIGRAIFDKTGYRQVDVYFDAEARDWVKDKELASKLPANTAQEILTYFPDDSFAMRVG